MTQTLPLWKNGKEDEQLDNHVLSDVDIEEPAPDTMVNRQTESSESDRPQRTRTIPKGFDDYVLATTNETIPKDYEEAIACEDKKHWENAMLEEIQNMYSHQVWELVPRPVNAKVVKSKWVFKISKDQEKKTYKARLVAMGYNQIPGRDYNESFSPVIKNATLRTILSMAATKDSVIKLFDVKAAYLNGNIENTIFMEQPAGFVQDRNKVCKLNKSIYGLPQSGRSWYEKFSQVLHDCGLEKLKSDPCVFKWKNEDKYFYVGIYVDDFITVSDSEDTSNRFINKLRHHLEIKDVTCKGMFLGIKIIQDKEGISLQQSHYVQQILQKYGMKNCKEVPTPGSKEINLDNHIEDDNCDQHTYQEALGMLMFLAVNTRPDIAYITSKLSQYSRQPKQMHWTAIKRVMRYLRGTIDLGVKFERGKTGILKSYTDASWSTTHDGKSYGGYVLKLGEATIDWKSSKQPLVALSTMEAEMIAACESCCQIKWIINLLRELGEWNFMEKPTAIYTDSQSLINWISSPKQSNRCRHINRKYHFLRDCYESRDICLLYKPSQDLEADIFTKDLSRDQMKKHLESLSIVGIKPKKDIKGGSVEGWLNRLVSDHYDPGSIPTLDTFFCLKKKNAPMAPDSCKSPTPPASHPSGDGRNKPTTARNKQANDELGRSRRGFVEDADLVAALRSYGQVTSIVQKMMEMGDSCWADARREAFITLRDRVKLSQIPARLDVKSKGVVIHVYVTYDIKCSLFYKQGHKRTKCPRKTGLQESNLLLAVDAPVVRSNAASKAPITSSAPSPSVAAPPPVAAVVAEPPSDTAMTKSGQLGSYSTRNTKCFPKASTNSGSAIID
ncbi:hypothetical protein LAZ67_1000955 [Cordylochernes scorpioides]|uniref:Reverse transcriptase Ty1/copia-type domain-containing protein n=1 Tax=Cordylochernes scorpioides TaxID=51811 RepID=A0ABY6JV23_9ARAC|nr:hypothetical protein LAZ67_1000955 [Cordylochernes scorpioides]